MPPQRRLFSMHYGSRIVLVLSGWDRELQQTESSDKESGLQGFSVKFLLYNSCATYMEISCMEIELVLIQFWWSPLRLLSLLTWMGLALKITVASIQKSVWIWIIILFPIQFIAGLIHACKWYNCRMASSFGMNQEAVRSRWNFLHALELLCPAHAS